MSRILVARYAHPSPTSGWGAKRANQRRRIQHRIQCIKFVGRLEKVAVEFYACPQFFHLLLATYALQPLMIFLKDKCFPSEIIGRQKALLILVDHSLLSPTSHLCLKEDPLDDGQRGVVGLLSFCSRHLTSLDSYPTVTKTMTLMKLHNLPLNKTSQAKVIDGLLTHNFVSS